MKDHLHSGIEDAVFIVLVAIVGINVVRLASAWLVQRGGIAMRVGETTGALVKF